VSKTKLLHFVFSDNYFVLLLTAAHCVVPRCRLSTYM